jgi:hypothetical protein
MWYLQDRICGFLLQNATALLTLPKIVCLKIPFLLPKTLPFGQSQITSSWFQKQQEFKIQTNNVP